MLKVLLYLVIALHMFIVIGNLGAFLALPFLAPWYVAIPLCSFLIHLMFNQALACPLTALENDIREKLGMRKISGFIGHYIMKPIYIAFGVKRKTTPNIHIVDTHPRGV